MPNATASPSWTTINGWMREWSAPTALDGSSLFAFRCCQRRCWSWAPRARARRVTSRRVQERNHSLHHAFGLGVKEEVAHPVEPLEAQVVRDPGRTPMQWTAEPGVGFTRPGVEPWLPFGDAARANVADQRSDPDSHLNLCRDLIALRRSTPDLRSGAYASLPSPEGVWAWRRGEDTLVAINRSGEPVSPPLGPATILLGTERSRGGEAVEGSLSLGAWEGAVLRAAPA